jgi:hypothetical protein
MRQALLLLPLLPAISNLLIAAAPELPNRFRLATPEPAIRKTVQPGHFLESVGRRAALLGREDGTFEAWINPIKLVRDFRLSVYFDDALEAVPLADLASRVEVSAGRVTIVHSHAAFTIRQTWVAALDQPLLLVLLDIETARPLRLRASFLPEMKPMWPASFGGQATWFEADDRALYFAEGLRRYYGFIGSPAFARSSEQIGHQLPDRTTLIEMDIAPAVARDKLIPIVIGCASKYQDAREAVRAALGRVGALVVESDQYWRDFESRTLHLTTPDPVINHAWRWARFALDKGWACNDRVGCGLIAGWAPSGASERPGFGWYFGGDALMNSWAILDYGDLPRVRALLEFLRGHQRADGKIAHELTQSAALLDWSQYPYGYYHGDTTPLYLFSCARYIARSGDLEFLDQSWDSINRAYQVCLIAADPDDGLLANKKAGAAAVETGALSGRVVKDVYLQGVWLAGLDAYRMMADLKRGSEKSRDAASRLAKARASLNAWFLPGREWLPFGRLTDGTSYEALSGWQAFALAWGGLDAEKSQRAAATLNAPELSADWGIRLFASNSPHYDPLSYNDGSVWPFVTGFAAMAEYRNHRAGAALQHLYGLAAVTGLTGAGFIPEYMSGDRAQALPHAVPHQLFSSSAVVHPLVSGLLGLDGDALTETLSVAPHLPSGWDRVEFARYRIGKRLASGTFTQAAGALRLLVAIDGPPVRIRFAPALPKTARAIRANLNGTAAGFTVEASLVDVHPVTVTPPVSRAIFEVTWSGAADPMPELVLPSAGDKSHATRY